MEEKAETLASQGKWALFIDILALLAFGIVLFLNIDGLVDLAAINVFLAYHHNKESPVITVLAYVYDTFDLRCENSNARRAVRGLSVVRLLFMYGLYPTSSIMKVDLSAPYGAIACAWERTEQIGKNSWQA